MTNETIHVLLQSHSQTYSVDAPTVRQAVKEISATLLDDGYDIAIFVNNGLQGYFHSKDSLLKDFRIS